MYIGYATVRVATKLNRKDAYCIILQLPTVFRTGFVKESISL